MFHQTAPTESMHLYPPYNVEYSPLSIPRLTGVNEVKEEAGLEEVDDPVNNKTFSYNSVLLLSVHGPNNHNCERSC